MKVKQLLVAVAATLASASAFAVTPGEINSARGAGNLDEAWVSGASAPTFMLYNGYLAGCDAGTMTVYTSGSSVAEPGSLGNFMAYACERSGRVSVLYHTVSGGSLFAFLPHTTGAFRDRVGELGANTACTSGGNNASGVEVYTGCSLSGATAYPVAVDNGPARPAGGFSDVESSAFGAIAGDVAANGTETAAQIGQVFGLAVNKSLYRELQVEQGIYASIAAADAADPDYDPVNAPNVTSAQYASIASQGGGYQTDWSPIIPSSPNAGKAINLARRVPTSGTQGSSNIHFLKNPCSEGVSGALAPATAADSTGTFIVTENSGTGNVKETITAAEAAGEFAIGVVSMENDWRRETNAARTDYRFVALDGVHPEAGSAQGTRTNPNTGTYTYYTSRNTANEGEYQFHMEMVYYVANTASGFAATIIPEIVTGLASPADCSATPRGMTLNPLSGAACGFDVVTKHTNFGNNCKSPVLFF